MARGINKVTLIGRLGADPDMRETSSGAVANISVATSEQWKDKNTGEKKERTEWHRVVFFGRPAEVVGQYLYKGSEVYIEGRLQTDKWQDKNGNDRYTTRIYATAPVQMLGQRNNGNNQAQNQPAQQSPAPAGQPQAANPVYDDDIPF